LSDQKKKQKKTTVKTIKYRPGTEEGDYQIID
jgi:translation initiation factor IF-3